MLPDPWLTRWLPLIRERAVCGRVLEIGCGHGDDTAALAAAGLSVRAFDFSAAAVAVTRLRVPSARVEQRDLRAPFDNRVGDDGLHGLGVIIASLSLHYFPWAETQAIVRKIHHALRPGGVLLCRLNSTQDRHFGASGHPQIEPHFYSVKGEPKRFFDEADIRALFRTEEKGKKEKKVKEAEEEGDAGESWTLLSLEHFITRKYIQPKALWEAVLESNPAA